MAKALEKSRRFSVQALRSILTSALGFGADASAFSLLAGLSPLHYLAANAVSFTLGSTIVYAVSHAWVFPVADTHSHRKAYAVFIGLSAIGLGLNSLLMWAFVDGLGLRRLPGKVAAAVLVFSYNFLCRKFLVFRGKRDR